jgi:hypothetical protein
MQNLRLHVSRHGRAELLRLLDEKEIQYTKLHPAPGTIIASAEIIELIDAARELLSVIAVVFVLWLSRNKARQLIVQKQDNGVVHFKATAFTPAEIEKLAPKIERVLREARYVSVIQMKKDDNPET